MHLMRYLLPILLELPGLSPERSSLFNTMGKLWGRWRGGISRSNLFSDPFYFMFRTNVTTQIQRLTVTQRY